MRRQPGVATGPPPWSPGSAVLSLRRQRDRRQPRHGRTRDV